MPTADFEQAVLDQLSNLQAGQGELIATQKMQGGQITAIFHKLDGNGQPGLIAEVGSLRTDVSNVKINCAAIQAGKNERSQDEKDRKGLHWGAWLGIVCAILSGPAAVIVDHVWK